MFRLLLFRLLLTITIWKSQSIFNHRRCSATNPIMRWEAARKARTGNTRKEPFNSASPGCQTRHRGHLYTREWAKYTSLDHEYRISLKSPMEATSVSILNQLNNLRVSHQAGICPDLKSPQREIVHAQTDEIRNQRSDNNFFNRVLDVANTQWVLAAPGQLRLIE